MCHVTDHAPALAVRFSEQIISVDKYPSIFSRQMEDFAYILIWYIVHVDDHYVKILEKKQKLNDKLKPLIEWDTSTDNNYFVNKLNINANIFACWLDESMSISPQQYRQFKWGAKS